jgi:RNA polymerase sigma-70 factor, ECF subfamily
VTAEFSGGTAGSVTGETGESGDSLQDYLAQAYQDLRAMARSFLRREHAAQTLQPTALVHEAYLQLARQRTQWRSREHFCAIASMAMRRILVKHALRRRAAKRGGGRLSLALDATLLWCEQRCVDLIALNEALQRLAAFDPRQARIVEMRFFGGMSVEETAKVLNSAPRTVHREWNAAKAWLRGEVAKGDAHES